MSLLPKLMCPACWPAYAAVLSSVGLGFLISSTYLLPLTVVFFAVTLMSLAFGAASRHGLRPFWTGVGAAALILAGKFYLESTTATYVGVGLLIIASVWNTLPRRIEAAGLRPACVPAGDGGIGRESRKGQMQS